MKTVEQIDNQIAQYEDKIQQLKEERKKVLEFCPERRMAEQMHSMFCTHNHTDACDWHYGSWERPTNAHSIWLKKAKEAINQELTLEEMERIYRLIRG